MIKMLFNFFLAVGAGFLTYVILLNMLPESMGILSVFAGFGVLFAVGVYLLAQ